MALPTADRQLCHIFYMYTRSTRLLNIVHLIHFYFLTKWAVRLVLFFYFSQNVAVSLIFFLQVYVFDESTAMLSRVMPHFEAAIWHFPADSSLSAFEALPPVPSSFVPVLYFAPYYPLPFFFPSYSIYGVFSRKFPRIFRLFLHDPILATPEVEVLCQRCRKVMPSRCKCFTRRRRKAKRLGSPTKSS